MEQVGLKNQSDRIQSIDGYRGAAVILMVLGNFAASVRWVPSLLKHQPDIGLTFADLVAPMFIFAIALTVGPSMRRRRDRLGSGAARAHMAWRNLSLVGIGAIISAGEAIANPAAKTLSWGVLQCIGVSGLLLSILIFTPAWVRVLSGLLCLGLYQFLLDRYFLQIVLNSTHNGLVGTLSWTGLLLVSTAITDQFHVEKSQGRRTGLLVLYGVLAATAGILLAIWLPISKNRASATYMAVSLGFCLLAFALFHLLMDSAPGRLKWLQRVGRNPLALYIAHLLLLALVVAPGIDSWHAGAPIWLSLLQAAFLIAAILGLAFVLEKKGWILKM